VVEAAAAESVTVRFANGQAREFLRAYVNPLKRSAPPAGKAVRPAELPRTAARG
jgi:hypothetical protein